MVGVFAGSFNPIHNGHLILANYLCEFYDFDEIWISVSPHNPLKEQRGLLDDNHRIEMVKLAIQQQPKLKYTDIELSLPLPSYSINMLEALEQKHPHNQFALIIGSDNWKVFDKWHAYEQILARYPLCVYPRKGYDAENTHNAPNITFAHTPIIEISSTFVREGIANKKNMSYFIPEIVYSYIQKNNLYKKL